MHLYSLSPTKKHLRLSALPEKHIFRGIYRIAYKKNGRNEYGEQIVTIELHDSTGMQIGSCDQNLINWYQNKPYQIVKVKGFMTYSEDKQFVHLIEIGPANEIDNNDPISRLPRALCNDPVDLDRLIDIRQSIESYALGKFIDDIFRDEETSLAFIQVPASKNYHHNHHGGLLKHSIEVVEIALQQSFRNKDERDIAIVCALFHDLGKVKTLNANLTTTLGKMVGHDDLILEICAPALRVLDSTWQDASNTMRHVWSCASIGSRYGFERNCTIANIIQFADALSVDRYNQNKAFNISKKAYGLAWNGNKYYWRPTPEQTMKGRNRLCQHISTS